LSFQTSHTYSASKQGIEVPVELAYGTESARLVANIDTGASFCIFQREYAEAIGIAVESGLRQIVLTATGPFETFGHELEISCLGKRHSAMVYFAMQRAFNRNVLGRRGWIDHYRLGIIDYDQTLYLSVYDE
jgi:hypothetical protein